MFGWLFPPSCPCDPEAKRWIERRLDWLHREFPDNVFTGSPMILPTDEFFPDAYTPTPDGAELMKDRVAGWMGIHPGRIRLEVTRLDPGVSLVNERGQALPGAAGLFQGGDFFVNIALCESQLQNPSHLVGTIAHEIAHERLMGEGRMTGHEFDNELLTDLTVVHMGLGIFLANSPRNWESHQSHWPDSTLTRPEYMSPPMYGYALAQIAWHQGTTKPPWRRFLGTAVRADFRQAVRYLFETGDTAFWPVRE
ncbi:MAG: hypothetical protein IT450_18890 [Phycisphaerales bacterium]|nr:hypothetical protein [Phycisphaerales bacterium]